MASALAPQDHFQPQKSAPSAENRGEAGTFGLPILERLWRSILAHKITIAAILALALVSGLVLTLLATPLYTATSRIEISRQQDNVTDVEGVETEDFSRDLEFYGTQYSLLRARSLAERVARSENLAGDDSFFEAFGIDPDVALSGRSRADARRKAERMSLVTNLLEDNILIVPVRGSSLVDIQFTSPDRGLSARIANAWVEQFSEATLDRRFSSTNDARKFLEKRLEELREKLEESERQLNSYASSKGIVSLNANQDAEGRTTQQQTLAGADLVAMNEALAKATADRIDAQSRANPSGGINDKNLTNSAINGLRQRRAIVASERAKLLTQFEPQYPSVRALSSEIQALDRSIAIEEGRIKSSGRNEYAEALQRERSLKQRVAQLKDQLVNQRSNEIQYNIYQREVDTNRELYDGLLQRYKEIGVAGVESSNISVIDNARAPNQPSSPNLALNLGLALLAGIALSGAYVFAREHVDQSLRDPSDVKSQLGLAPLGVVPNVETEDVIQELQDRKSALSEAYFSIGTNLSFLTENGVPQTMMLTSSRPNEGKTTSAYAICRVLQRMGKKTVLVDADMRNPSVHFLFEIQNDAGLSNFLSGDDDLEKLIADLPDQSVSVIPAGPAPPNAAELLTGDRLAALLRRLSEEFDHIVVDAPPILGIADVPLLVSRLDGVIFAIEANGPKLAAINSAIDRVRSVNGNIFGAIVTKVTSHNSPYGYGYGSHYGYGYDRQRDSEKAS